jgi:hypothetical protein
MQESEAVAEVIPFPRRRGAEARPPRAVRVALLAGALAGVTAAAVWLANMSPRGGLALAVPLAALAVCLWLAGYSVRCRLKVDVDGIRYYGFLPSRLVRLSDLEAVTVVHTPRPLGWRKDRGHLLLRRRGSPAAFKLSLAWDGAREVASVLERLVPHQFRSLEAS